MTRTLILPVAGRSSRFPEMRPKWLLTMPDGKLMIEKSIEGLNLHTFDRVIVSCLKEHFEQYLSSEFAVTIARDIGYTALEFCLLDEPTSSQSETVATTLKSMRVNGSFFVKDSDNVFDFNWNGGNEVAYVSLHDVESIEARSKSYILDDAINNITNIIEKQVISDKFCCGGYGFASAQEFLEHFEAIASPKEVYISHVIYSMIMGGCVFTSGHAKSYFDWGTAKEYRKYQSSLLTIFSDIDGVLFKNGSKFSKLGWKTDPIVENVKFLADLQSTGRLYLVLTTSRPESEKEYILENLAALGLVPDQFVMGLPHGKRVLVNDFSNTNTYPTALAVNLARDSEDMKKHLNYLFY